MPFTLPDSSGNPQCEYQHMKKKNSIKSATWKVYSVTYPLLLLYTECGETTKMFESRKIENLTCNHEDLTLGEAAVLIQSRNYVNILPMMDEKWRQETKMSSIRIVYKDSTKYKNIPIPKQTLLAWTFGK